MLDYRLMDIAFVGIVLVNMEKYLKLNVMIHVLEMTWKFVVVTSETASIF